VRVISKRALRDFWRKKPHRESEPLLVGWNKVLLSADWRNFGELRQTFNSADRVGDCVVFNVGGNKYRIIGRVRFSKSPIPGVVYILRVMTHVEYDENTWPSECGCYLPPPRRKRRDKPR
jgi:mRNA interferase HigB